MNTPCTHAFKSLFAFKISGVFAKDYLSFEGQSFFDASYLSFEALSPSVG